MTTTPPWEHVVPELPVHTALVHDLLGWTPDETLPIFDSVRRDLQTDHPDPV